jgi:ribosome-binding factor A
MGGMAKNSYNSGRGPSQRQLRVGEVIRRTMSELLMRGEIHDPDLNRLSITVSEVRVTPDLKVATAFVLPLGGKGKDEAIALLAKNAGELRRMVTKTAGLKHSPQLKFRIDDTFDRVDETHRLLSQDAVRRDLDRDDTEDGGDA